MKSNLGLGVYSLLSGATAADRRVLTATDATDPTADPTLATDGYDFRGSNWLHIYLAFPAGVTQVLLTPWFYNTAAGAWYESNQLTFNATTKFALLEQQREDRVFFVIDAITGVGTVDVWASGNR